MSRTSLTNQLARLRSKYTGETASQVIPAIKQVTRALAGDQRDLLADILRGRPADPPTELRQALFPAALTHPQRELETAVLAAATRAASHLQLRPPVDVSRPAHALRAVEPERAPRHRLILHPHHHGLGPLLLELLPRAGTERVEGLPGLRYRQHARCVELFLLGTDASVILAGVSRKIWHAAVTFGGNWLALRESTPQWLWQQYPGTLSGTEKSHVDTHGRVAGSAYLGSALLRRYGLLHGAAWVTMWASDKVLLLEWPGTPAPTDVSADLLHPIYGLGGMLHQDHPSPDSVRLIGEEQWGELLLRTVLPPGVSGRFEPAHWPEDFFAPWRIFAEMTT